MHMSKKNIIKAVVILVVVVGIGLLINKKGTDSGYSVVYLTTGEVYVGQLTTFPDLQLRNGYILNVVKDTTDPSKSNFQLNPISEALWAPESLHLTTKNVIFYGSLLKTSKIAQTIAAKVK